MNFFTFTLFSFRNVVLVLIGVLTTRSLSATIDNLDGSLPSNSNGLELPASFLFESLLQGQGLGDEVEFIPIPALRSVIEEILGDDQLFILTSDTGSETESWLGYLAPEGLPFELALNNATISLQSLSLNSLEPFSQPDLLEVTSLPLEQGFQPEGPGVSFEIFIGINLTKMTSLDLENTALPGGAFPQYSLSDFVSGDNNSIPEPSSVLFIFLGLGCSLFARKRS